MGQVNIDALASAYQYTRPVVWWATPLETVGIPVGVALRGSAIVEVVGLAWLVLLLATTVALAIYAYKTAIALGFRAGWSWVWVVALAIPCANVASLLILSARATNACESQGVPVGFLGPKIGQNASGGSGPGGAA